MVRRPRTGGVLEVLSNPKLARGQWRGIRVVLGAQASRAESETAGWSWRWSWGCQTGDRQRKTENKSALRCGQAVMYGEGTKREL